AHLARGVGAGRPTGRLQVGLVLGDLVESVSRIFGPSAIAAVQAEGERHLSTEHAADLEPR
ncbi:MAG: hypothetical protein ACR2H0_02630, partial [Candidatus Limnocylindrales bacterium]